MAMRVKMALRACAEVLFRYIDFYEMFWELKKPYKHYDWTRKHVATYLVRSFVVQPSLKQHPRAHTPIKNLSFSPFQRTETRSTFWPIALRAFSKTSQWESRGWSPSAEFLKFGDLGNLKVSDSTPFFPKLNNMEQKKRKCISTLVDFHVQSVFLS